MEAREVEKHTCEHVRTCWLKKDFIDREHKQATPGEVVRNYTVLGCAFKVRYDVGRCKEKRRKNKTRWMVVVQFECGEISVVTITNLRFKTKGRCVACRAKGDRPWQRNRFAPEGYYVYAWVEDGRPTYIGKGKNLRGYRDKSKNVVILDEGLTEEVALTSEKSIIKSLTALGVKLDNIIYA